jgi:hypothetical protein
MGAIPGVADIRCIRLSRGMCFGTCPVYEVVLAADGRAWWHGEGHVDRIGRYEGRIDQEQFQRLAGTLIRAGFFDWLPSYASGVTCSPDHVIEVTSDRGVVKRVVQNGTDEPRGFARIGKLIDRIAADIDWRRNDAYIKE